MCNMFCNIAVTMLRVLALTFETICKGFFSWVVKRATSGYSTRFAAKSFLLPVLPYLYCFLQLVHKKYEKN